MVDQPSPHPETKRGRGRPRKYPVAPPDAPRRGRGRPRKYPVVAVADTTVLDSVDTTQEIAPVLAAPITPAPSFPPSRPMPSARRPTRAAGRFRRSVEHLAHYRPSRQALAMALLAIATLVTSRQGVVLLHRPPTHASTTATALEQLARLTDLPKGETPDLYTVRDASSISQPFLKDAQNGDLVFLYRQAGKAIVFRPADKTIVAVGPIAARTLVAVTSIGLYNGTPVAGITSREEAVIGQKFAQTSIAIKDKAARQDYPKTIVVDLSGQHTDQAKALADYYHAAIVPLPAGETAPQADVLIIFGADAE